MCAYHCVQVLYTTQHRTVLIIFLLILQTIIIAQMMSTGGKGELPSVNGQSLLRYSKCDECKLSGGPVKIDKYFKVLSQLQLVNSPCQLHCIAELVKVFTSHSTQNRSFQRHSLGLVWKRLHCKHVDIKTSGYMCIYL